MRRKPKSKVRFSFVHVSGNRNSMTRASTSKRLSRQLTPNETSIQYRTVTNIRNSLKKQQGRSSYPRLSQQNHYCFLDGHCLTSPSKRPRPPPQACYHEDAGYRPYWGELPTSPTRSSHLGTGNIGGKLHKIDSSQAGQFVAKPSPAEAALAIARYSVFPKSSRPQTGPDSKGRISPKTLKHAESVTKSPFRKQPSSFFAPSKGPPIEGRPHTPTVTNTHASVCTVQELLPYRQEFREAGLAVTSADQKAARSCRKQLQSSARAAEPVPLFAPKRRVVKLRPSMFLFVNKPLPATPLPQQAYPKEGRCKTIISF